MNKYKIIQEIGKGSYGSVYKIMKNSHNDNNQASQASLIQTQNQQSNKHQKQNQQSHLQQEDCTQNSNNINGAKYFCWKEINYGHLSEKERSQIVSEINCLSKLNHPNIVRYIENIVQREDKKIFIVMEYCVNGDMAQLIKKCKVDNDFVHEDVIWKIFMQILLALRECHYKGLPGQKILHRDIKPSNVFFDSSNNVKLGDFGLSRIIKNESQNNSNIGQALAETNVGTPYYMSPEQINENQYDEKTDIWSLGCVIYELVSLSPPFTANSHLALAEKILAGEIQRIPERYSEDLQEVIQWMLKIDSKERPTVEDLIKIPKIKLRIHERKRRDEYARLKYKESRLDKREQDLKQKQIELQKKAEELKQKEIKANQAYQKQLELYKQFKMMQSLRQQDGENQLTILAKKLESKNQYKNADEGMESQEINVDKSVVLIGSKGSSCATKNYEIDKKHQLYQELNQQNIRGEQDSCNSQSSLIISKTSNTENQLKNDSIYSQGNQKDTQKKSSSLLKSHESLQEQIRLMKMSLAIAQQNKNQYQNFIQIKNQQQQFQISKNNGHNPLQFSSVKSNGQQAFKSQEQIIGQLYNKKEQKQNIEQQMEKRDYQIQNFQDYLPPQNIQIQNQ